MPPLEMPIDTNKEAETQMLLGLSIELRSTEGDRVGDRDIGAPIDRAYLHACYAPTR